VDFLFGSAEKWESLAIVNNLPPNMPRHTCPHCGSRRSWEVRRQSRKCAACRREWSTRKNPVAGIRADEKAWRAFLFAALRYRTVGAIRLHFPASRPTLLAMCLAMRNAMAADVPATLSGVVEVDETYVSGTWHNKPWSVRRLGTKRGRGTSKQPVFGILERGRGVVRAFLVPDAKKSTIMPIILATVEAGSTIYSDGYRLYRETPKHGYRHAYVDHAQHEYGRGEVHSNGMEGFWGYLKRGLKTTGGIRRDRLGLFVSEEVWRYNRRKDSEKEKIERLLDFLGKFGG